MKVTIIGNTVRGYLMMLNRERETKAISAVSTFSSLDKTKVTKVAAVIYD